MLTLVVSFVWGRIGNEVGLNSLLWVKDPAVSWRWQTLRSHYGCLPCIDPLRCCLESRAFLKRFQGKTMPVQTACCLGGIQVEKCVLWALSQGHRDRRQERSIPLDYQLIQSGDDSCFTSQSGLVFHVFVTFYSNAKYVKLNCTNHNDRTIAERNQDILLTQP